MNWGSLFFSAEGRVGQRDFWLACLLLLLFSVFIHALPGLGTLIWLVSFYSWICVFSKRLHDIGRSGWVQALPFVLGWVLMTTGFFMGVAGLIGLFLSGMPHFLGGVVLGGLALGLGVFCLGGLMHLILIVWLGLTPGQIGSNRYGPPAGQPLTARLA